MGKAQTKKRTHTKRHNPIRVPDAHLGGGRADGKANPDKERQVLPVLEKLSAPEYADRTWACAAISNLIQEDPAMRRLFQGRNVVGALIERLSDDIDEVVVEASGALRNLAIDGGHEICGEMYNKGIMSHLKVLVGKVSQTIDAVLAGPAKKLSDEDLQHRKHLLALTENIIVLVWSLAEANWKTLDAVNAAGVEGLLLKVLQGRDKLSVGVTLAAAQALYALTQDNAPFSSALLAHSNSLSVLVDIVRADHTSGERDTKGKGKAKKAMEEDEEFGDGRALLTRVLVAGTLRNVVQPGSPADASVGIVALTNEVILPLVNSLLDINPANIAQRATELVAEIPKDGPVLGKDLKVDHRSPAEVKLERIERMLATVSAALEVLTSICAGLEDVDEEAMEQDNDDDADMDDEMGDEDLIARGRDPKTNGSAQAAPAVHTAVTLPHLLSTLNLPTRLLALGQLTPLSLPPTGATPSVHAPTTAALSMVHLRALEALNNLLLSTAAAVAGGEAYASMLPASLWEGLLAIISNAGSDATALSAKGQEMRMEIMEAALGCAWGLSKTIPSSAPSTASEMLMQAVPVLNGESAARAVDTLASLAARPAVPLDENRTVAQWLMGALTASPNAEMTVALVNAIIDIYADEGREYDAPVFVAGGMTEALAGTVARVRGTARSVDRRKNLVLRARAEEAYDNLVAFIKYRRSL